MRGWFEVCLVKGTHITYMGFFITEKNIFASFYHFSRMYHCTYDPGQGSTFSRYFLELAGFAYYALT
jgi:hypothetical protein